MTLTKTGTQKGITAAKKKLETGQATGLPTSPTPPLTAATFIQNQANKLEPFKTSGATMSAEDGRRLMLMATMSFGFPETYYGDVSVGTLATAKSLDLPTELKIVDRQKFWESIIKSQLSYVLLQSVNATGGALRSIGRVTFEPDGVEQVATLTWNEGIDSRVIVQFPPIKESDVGARVKAISEATLGGEGIPPETAVQEMLKALGIQDIDKVLVIWQEIQDERAANPQPESTIDEAYGQAMSALSEALAAVSQIQEAV